MPIVEIVLIVLGLGLFETVSSIDNAVINAEVLSTMGTRSRRWFLVWGILLAVFVIRGLLPWVIVWTAIPSLGPVGALTAAFSSNPQVIAAVETSAPLLLVGGGTFLVLLFFHWLFLEPKNYGLAGERFFHSQGVWYYAVASLIMVGLTYICLQINPLMALSATLGSSAFFITHGFKQNAEEQEQRLTRHSGLTDTSKILYLEIIDATFSIDGVLGAFAFTLSVPLIVIGSGLGAIMVRHLTMGNIERIKRYRYLKNGAMYSIFFLGAFMLLESFGAYIPNWLSPVVTATVIGYFFAQSRSRAKPETKT